MAKLEWTLSYDNEKGTNVLVNGNSMNDIFDSIVDKHRLALEQLIDGKTLMGYREGKTFLENGNWFIQDGRISYAANDRIKKNKPEDSNCNKLKSE